MGTSIRILRCIHSLLQNRLFPPSLTGVGICRPDELMFLPFYPIYIDGRLHPIHRFLQHVDQSFLPGAHLRLVLVLPSRRQRQTHQDALDPGTGRV